MANRYWVTGGTGNWNSTTNWSTASGGASGASVPGSADAALLDASSGSVTVTLDISPDIQTLTCTGFTGTLAFGTNTISLNSTGTIFTGVTTMTVTGTPLIICTNSSATARTITPTAVTEANSISFRITAGTGTLSLPAGSYRDLDFTDGTNPTGYAGALGNAVQAVYGNFKASTGMTRVAGTSGPNFVATSGIKTINTAGVTFDCPFSFSGVGGTWQLQAALTSGATRTVTLTNGTLDLNGYILFTGLFSSTSATTRTLAFGTGKIVITGSSATVFSTNTGTNLTITGSKRVEYTYSGSVGTRFISGPTTATAVPGTNTCSHYITAGTDIFSPNGARAYDTVDCTGFGGTLTSTNLASYGDLILSSVSTFSTSTLSITFGATSGTKIITSNSKSIDGNISFSGIGGAWQLQDNLTLSASTYAATLTNGTLDLNGYTLTAGTFGSSNSNIRTLAFGAGKIVLTGNATTVWSNGSTANLTVTGTPLVQATYSGSTGTRVFSALYNSEATSISLEVTAGSDSISLAASTSFYKNVSLVGFTGTYASTGTQVIVFGNWNWGGVTLVSSSAAHTFPSTSGTKTITSNGVSFGDAVSFTGVGGAWTCVDALRVVGALTMTNGTLKLKSGVTSTVGSFVTSGTTMKYLQSSTAGTQATISDASGTNSVSYLTIQDSNATGGASWLAPLTSNNVYGGNVTGWLFNAQYSATIVEASSVTDTVNPSNQISTSISESSALTDAANGGYLWNEITTTQDPNWQNIDNS
jgi:hypothetical protein